MKKETIIGGVILAGIVIYIASKINSEKKEISEESTSPFDGLNASGQPNTVKPPIVKRNSSGTFTGHPNHVKPPVVERTATGVYRVVNRDGLRCPPNCIQSEVVLLNNLNQKRKSVKAGQSYSFEGGTQGILESRTTTFV